MSKYLQKDFLPETLKPEYGWPLAEHPKLEGKKQNSSFQEFVP